jgi:hypothetical protein
MGGRGGRGGVARGIRAQGSSGVHVGARASCSQTKYAELLYKIYDRKRGGGDQRFRFYFLFF